MVNLQSKMAFLTKSCTLIKTIPAFKSITTFSFLNQEPQLAEPHIPPPPPSQFPPSPSTGSPLYNQNWRTPVPHSAHTLTPLNQPYSLRPHQLHQDVNQLMNLFAGWVTEQRWADVKHVFEQWIGSLDGNGKPNKPNVQLFNQYLRAHLMSNAPAGELLDVVAQMGDYAIEPNTASYNLVLKAMHHAREADAAEKLLERMAGSGKESQPDDESYDLVVSLLFQQDKTEAALKYVDILLKSGYVMSSRVFVECVKSCISKQRLETLVSVIEKCKAMDQNKALTPSWNISNTIAEAAIQNDNSRLTFLALGFLAKWMKQGENARPPVHLSVNEGLVIKALSTAARTYDSTLLDASWTILKKSLGGKTPNPESYLAKINAFASLGKLPSAFSTLNELEITYSSLSYAAVEDLLSPFTSLRPLVVACSKKGYETLDEVYFQLENLSRSDPPYKSVAALNCVILGCANVWDLDRAYQTFEAISSTFGLTPNIHSYNALMYAFGKLRKTQEAARVFEHLSSLGVKPNAMSYSLLVDAHLVNRDPKAALSVLDGMIDAGFKPSRETLNKVRRRCIREVDNESIDVLQSIADQCKISLGGPNRRNMLFNVEYNTEFTT